MSSLLVVIFCVELVVQLVNTIGAGTINNLLWQLVLMVPSPLSRSDLDKKKKQADYFAVRRELKATSSQDEFAKWAKLRRQHDKLLDALERQKKSTEATRAKFDAYLTTARLVSTKGLQWFLPFWYSREPMFWLPHAWFPYYIEWFASFPRAPIGSVSIVVWQWACTAVLALAMETVLAMVGLARSARQKQGVPAGTRVSEAKPEKASSKKEL